MSLTSYRAAPPRDGVPVAALMVCVGNGAMRSCGERLRLVRFGGDLLSHVLRRSTIGATALNGRVRDGIGCFARAMTTKPKERQAGLIARGRRFQPFRAFAIGPCGFSTGNISVVPSPGVSGDTRMSLLTFIPEARGRVRH